MGCRRPERINHKRVDIPVFIFAILLQLIFLTALAAPTVEPYDRHIDREILSPSRPVVTVVRQYRLHNRCSGRHVAVRGRQIQATARPDSSNAFLLLETLSFNSRIRIRSANNFYLCFNLQGRLTVKQTGKGTRCLFHEKHSANDYTEFQSVANPSWFIGFKKNGQRLVGDQWRKAKDSRSPMKCYQFTKFTNLTDGHHHHHRSALSSSSSSSTSLSSSPQGEFLPWRPPPEQREWYAWWKRNHRSSFFNSVAGNSSSPSSSSLSSSSSADKKPK